MPQVCALHTLRTVGYLVQLQSAKELQVCICRQITEKKINSYYFCQSFAVYELLSVYCAREPGQIILTTIHFQQTP
jgi:hypothetical protein